MGQKEISFFTMGKTGFPHFQNSFFQKNSSAKKDKFPRIFRKFKELSQKIGKNNFCTVQRLFDNFMMPDTIGALSRNESSFE
jgi:hypothetical protein